MQELTEAHEIADSIARLSDVDAALEFRSLPKNLGLERSRASAPTNGP